MTRDMDLIRELLLKLEAFPVRSGSITNIWLDKDNPQEEFLVEGFTIEQVDYHLHLIDQAGFIVGSGSKPRMGINFKSLSWDGHDFLDAIRSPEVWRKTKKGALEVGGLTFDLVKDLAKGFIKKQIENKTGILI